MTPRQACSFERIEPLNTQRNVPICPEYRSSVMTGDVIHCKKMGGCPSKVSGQKRLRARATKTLGGGCSHQTLKIERLLILESLPTYYTATPTYGIAKGHPTPPIPSRHTTDHRLASKYRQHGTQHPSGCAVAIDPVLEAHDCTECMKMPSRPANRTTNTSEMQ